LTAPSSISEIAIRSATSGKGDCPLFQKLQSGAQLPERGLSPHSGTAISSQKLTRSVLLTLLLIAACASPPAPPAQEITIWRKLGAWSGRGLLQADAFISDTGQLRITWEARDAAGSGPPGTLRITLHSAVSGRPLAVAVDQRGSGRDIAYVTEDPRSFYLVIEATNLDWSVEVAEGIPAIRK
jgi:hypothetical protein